MNATIKCHHCDGELEVKRYHTPAGGFAQCNKCPQSYDMHPDGSYSSGPKMTILPSGDYHTFAESNKVRVMADWRREKEFLIALRHLLRVDDDEAYEIRKQEIEAAIKKFWDEDAILRKTRKPWWKFW